MTQQGSKKRNGPSRLKDIFRTWLFILILAAFCFTFALSFLTQRKQAEHQANESLGRQVSYVSGQIQELAGRERLLKQESGNALLSKAQALAFTLLRDPSVLGDYVELEDMMQKMGLDAFYITDATGVIVCSIPRKHVGTFDFHDYETTRPYLGLIDDKDATIIEEPRPNDDELASTGTLRYQQFAGCARLDEPGIVQVAYSSEQYDASLAAVSLDTLAKNFRVGERGFLLISRDGGLVSASRDELFSAPPELSGETLLSGEPFRMVYGGEEYTARAVSENGSTVLAAMPLSEAYQDVWKLLLWSTAFYLVTFVSVYLQILRLLSRVVVDNIDRTNESLKRITDGDLNERIEVTDNEEFRELSVGINTTVTALKHYISQAEDRIRAELEFARAIQHSALPSVFPPFPERREFELYATMDTAREVGGDFYDFFFVDTDKLALVMADVSGKGIPAALLMMKSKTLIKSLTESGLSPREVITLANRKLCEGNDAEMFVTAWLGIWEISSGRLTCVNAGHEYPILRRADGSCELYRDRHWLVLGAMESARYEQYELRLSPGDTVFLYTDGVTEATDTDLRLYGTDRLIQAIDRTRDGSAEALIEAVTADIAGFVGTAPQFDDITMMALRVNVKE